MVETDTKMDGLPEARPFPYILLTLRPTTTTTTTTTATTTFLYLEPGDSHC